MLLFVISYDVSTFICRTFQSKVKKNKVPHPAVANKLSVEWLSGEFRNFRQLETVLAGRRFFSRKLQLCSKVSPQRSRRVYAIFPFLK